MAESALCARCVCNAMLERPKPRGTIDIVFCYISVTTGFSDIIGKSGRKDLEKLWFGGVVTYRGIAATKASDRRQAAGGRRQTADGRRSLPRFLHPVGMHRSVENNASQTLHSVGMQPPEQQGRIPTKKSTIPPRLQYRKKWCTLCT